MNKNLEIKFYSRGSTEQTVISIPSDSVEIEIPTIANSFTRDHFESGVQPSLKITVNTERITVDYLHGDNIETYRFNDLI